MAGLFVRPATPADHDRVTRLLTDSWGGTTVVGHGRAYDAAALPALLAERSGEIAGLLTYEISDAGMEIVTLDAVAPGAADRGGGARGRGRGSGSEAGDPVDW